MTVESQLNYFFFDKALLKRALSHHSYQLEQQQAGYWIEDQEAYISLGDCLLHTVLTELLIRTGYSSGEEIAHWVDQLTQIEHLAVVSQSIEIDIFVKLGTEEKQQGINADPAVLANTLKAVLAGIYFDGGFSATREVIRRLFKDSFLTVEW